MSKITIRFKSGHTKEVDQSNLPRIKNIFPSVQVVTVEQAKPAKAKKKETNPDDSVWTNPPESNDPNTISGE